MYQRKPKIRPNPMHQSINFFYFIIFLTLLPYFKVYAQKGDLKDNPGVVQHEVWKAMDVPPAPILTPKEALKSFTLPKGFTLELVASEPLVNDPVAMAWDEDGRLYVVEMWTFMPDVDGTGEETPGGRIVVLEDHNNDGIMDRSTVVLDKLVMPRAVAVVKGGLLIAEPPTLWFCEDTNNDLVCDKKTKVDDYAVKGSVEHRENGLVRNIDNWLYNAKSKRRFKWDGEKLQQSITRMRGQWGITHDDYGRLFYTNNSNLLRADFYPPEYLTQNPGLNSQFLRPNAQTVASEQRVYSVRNNVGVNRGYNNNTLRPDNRLNKATSVSGLSIYRGGNKLPISMYGNAFVAEPAANLVAQMRLREGPIEFVADRVTYQNDQWDRVDFLASTDERFRPVNVYNGPDGYLYIVDMYRGVLQHREFLTTFLRKQIIERGLDKPVGLGRIYRVVHEDSPEREKIPALSKFSESKLVSALLSDNGWIRDQAQRLLVEREQLKKSTIKKLRKLVDKEYDLAAIHALWVLHAHQEINEEIAIKATQHSNPWVRVHAIRTAESLLSQSAENSPLTKSFIALSQDAALRVRLQVIQSLGILKSDTLVFNTIANLYHPDSENMHMVDAAVASLYRRESQFIEHSLNHPAWMEDRGRSQLLNKLAQAIFNNGQGERILEIVDRISKNNSKNWKTAAVFDGLALAANDKKAKPIKLTNKPTEFFQQIKRLEPKRADKLGVLFTWEGKKDNDLLSNLSREQMAAITRGKEKYLQFCAGCHAENGEGIGGLAPALSDSPWVNDSAVQLALIIVQGLSGPLTLHGQTWDGVMPPHGAIPDLQEQGLADLLSYLRSSWANKSGPITYAEIEDTLERYKTRNQLWTVKELEKLRF